MNKIKYIIKYSSIIYNIYFYFFSFCLNVFGKFIKTDNKMILFNSFGGRKYDDSPKAIFEKMIKDSRYDDYKLLWAINNVNDFEIPERAIVIKDYSLKFFIYALKSKVWITNSSIEHGLSFKKKKTIYVNTWHGSAIKYLGDDVKKEGKSFKGKSKSKEDIFFSQSQFDEYVFERAFHIDKNTFKRFGLPRNDELSNVGEDKINAIKEKLQLPKEKKIVLYAPTYREYNRNKMNEVTQDIQIDLNKWQNEFGDDYILLIRAHYEVAKKLELSTTNNIRDVSKYPRLNELLIVSDLLISDYSSIFFDYSILHRPILCYAYDFDKYLENRGMYIDLKKDLPCKVVKNNQELLNEVMIIFKNYNCYSEKVKPFQEKYVSEHGNASKRICDYLYDILK